MVFFRTGSGGNFATNKTPICLAYTHDKQNTHTCICMMLSIIQIHVHKCTYYHAFIQKNVCVLEYSKWYSHCDCAVFGGCVCVHVCVGVCECLYVSLYMCVFECGFVCSQSNLMSREDKHSQSECDDVDKHPDITCLPLDVRILISQHFCVYALHRWMCVFGPSQHV